MSIRGNFIKLATLLAIAATTSPIAAMAKKSEGAPLRFAVISDLHTMSPELLVNEGEAFDNYLANDRKMLKESTAILDALCDKLLDADIEAVLITGDLTKDGEAASHSYLKENFLKTLSDNNIKVLVTPGNHDINNPDAVIFDGDKKERTTTISPEEFAEIYADYGYADAIARDKHSLSYVYQLTPSIRVLSMEGCLYEQNDFDDSHCYHEGEFRKGTEDFIYEQLRDARDKGITVIGMMHHGMVEHWKYQNKVLAGYLIDDWKRIARKMERLGLNIVFTGHSHSQDISQYKSLYDIQTGSTVSYPCPYRIATINNSGIQIESRLIDEIDYDLGGQEFIDFSRTNTENGFVSALDGILGDMLPDKIPADLQQEVINVIAHNMTINYYGDETLSDEDAAQIKKIGNQVRKHSLKWGILFKTINKSLRNDAEPEDNNITIEFK